MRIVVIGGTGLIGSKTVACCAPPIMRIDLVNSRSFE